MTRKYVHPPVHPGKILFKEFIYFFGLNQNRLAQNINVPPRRINEIVLGKRGITADTALRLAHYFGNSAFFWMQLQCRYELKKTKELLGNRLEKEVKLHGIS
ncbi:addiction module antidote protein, HigA family [Candidatus Peregrinibacteria bacterium RIFCSPLOWO2_01_FULL_48_20]|nr:MAG: addiction module antidote protein, HigA family [Candidatus Peregrinibacteria bacterium RIFCSPLOWO2_01_FULL_48_20]